MALLTENKSNGRSGRANGESDRDQNSGGGHYQPYKTSKRSFRETGDSFCSSRKFRYFVCASEDDFHKLPSCTADRLVNGKLAILSGKGCRDRDGAACCFAFNGYSGCPVSTEIL
jgi:hypothetical protein